MDTLYKLFLEKKLVDVELVLDDGLNTLRLFLHKVLLIEHSPYFEKLFTFGDNPSIVTLKVPNIFVAQDVILSIYGQNLNSSNLSKWPHALALAKSRDYFGLEALPIDLPEKIDSVDYDCVLELCEMMGFDENNLRILSDNLPVDYDLTKLSREFSQEIVKNKMTYVISLRENKKIILKDILTGLNVYEFCAVESKITDYMFSPNNKYLATKHNKELRIWYCENSLMIYRFEDCLSYVFSPDGDLIALNNYDHIKILDLNSNEIIAQIEMVNITYDLVFVPFSQNKQLIILEDNVVRLWNIETSKVETLIGGFDAQIFFAKNGKYVEISFMNVSDSDSDDNDGLDTDSNESIVYNNKSKIKIFNISTETPIELYTKDIIMETSFVCYTKYGELECDNDDYVLLDKNGQSEIYNINTNSLVQKIPYNAAKITIDNRYIKITIDSSRDTMQIRNIITGEEFFRSGSRIGYLFFSSTCKFCAEKYDDEIKVWEVATKHLLFKIENIFCEYDEMSMKFTPNEKYLVISDGFNMHVYNITKGKLINEMALGVYNIRVYHNALCQRLLEEKID